VTAGPGRADLDPGSKAGGPLPFLLKEEERPASLSEAGEEGAGEGSVGFSGRAAKKEGSAADLLLQALLPASGPATNEDLIAEMAREAALLRRQGCLRFVKPALILSVGVGCSAAGLYVAGVDFYNSYIKQG
jgi:hypothetical protein